MPAFRRMVIAGLGLMGGSLGMAVRKNRLAEEVIGLARRGSTLDDALRCGAIDRGTLDPEEAAAGADFLLLAAPVQASMDLGRHMIPWLASDALISDVCSTKAWLLAGLAENLPKGLSLIGGHPMAGAEKAGIEFASADLFHNARYLLVPRVAEPSVCDRLLNLVKGIGAIPEYIGMEEHDRLTAMVSHLPHAVAQSLVNTLADLSSARMADLAAGGFRDITRIASSDPRMWSDIYLTNRDEVLQALDLFGEQISLLTRAIRSGNEVELTAFLRKSKTYRDGLSK